MRVCGMPNMEGEERLGASCGACLGVGWPCGGRQVNPSWSEL